MKQVTAIACLSIAAALAVRPLPRLPLKTKVVIPRLAPKGNLKPKMTFEDQLQFIFNLKSQLQGGANQLDALGFSIHRAPEFAFTNTKQALVAHSNAISALNADAMKHRFPLLISCSDLLELSSNSGSSIIEPLTQIADRLMARRSQEQLIATELASTKATVFVLAGLPVMGAGLGLILGSDSIKWLIASSPGQVCLALGIGFELLGWLWIKRLLNRVLADVT